MLQKTIEAVRTAEESAEKYLAETREKCASMIEDAKNNAAQLARQTEEENQSVYDSMMADARIEGDRILEENSIKTAKQIEEMRKEAGAREAKAVQAVLDTLI